MAVSKDADTGIWLHNKLGSTDDLWSGSSICSQLTRERLLSIQDCFQHLQPHVKVKLMLCFLHLPKRNVEEWKAELEEIVDCAQFDTDQWVAVVGDILRTYPSTGNLNSDVNGNHSFFHEVLNDLKKIVKKCPESGMLPMECPYLSRNAMMSITGQQPQPVKHFALKRKPKSAALRADLLQKSAEVANNAKKNCGTTVPVKIRSFAKNFDNTTPLRGIPSARTSSSASTGFIRQTSVTGRNTLAGLNRPTVSHKEGGIKLLDITDTPIGLREAKRRKKHQDHETMDQQKKQESAPTVMPDYAAGLLAPSLIDSVVGSSNVPSYLPTQTDNLAASSTTTTTTAATTLQQLHVVTTNHLSTSTGIMSVLSPRAANIQPQVLMQLSQSTTPSVIQLPVGSLTTGHLSAGSLIRLQAAGSTTSTNHQTKGIGLQAAGSATAGSVSNVSSLRLQTVSKAGGGNVVQLQQSTVASTLTLNAAAAAAGPQMTVGAQNTSNIRLGQPGAMLIQRPLSQSGVVQVQQSAGTLLTSPPAGTVRQILVARPGGVQQLLTRQMLMAAQQPVAGGSPVGTPVGTPVRGVVLQQSPAGSVCLPGSPVITVARPGTTGSTLPRSTLPIVIQRPGALLQPLRTQLPVTGVTNIVLQQRPTLVSSPVTPATSPSVRGQVLAGSPPAVIQLPAGTQNQPKKGLSLTKEQMVEAQEMFRTSNKVTRPEKALILGFMAGSRDNPCQGQGDIINIRLSENIDTVQTPEGIFRPMIVETYFQMNYASGESRRITKMREKEPEAE